MRTARIIFRRILWQRWGTVVIVTSLAFGIGANGAMYALFRAVFVRPYSFDRRHQVVEICQQERGYTAADCVDSWPDLHDLREASQSYIAITAYRVYGATLFLGEDEKDVEITEADPNFSEVTGIRPRFGRMFGREDFAEGAPLVGIISDALWRRTFLGDPRIIGGLVHVRSQDVRVVGIMPPKFAFPFDNPAFGAKGTDVWIPSHNRNEKRTRRNLRAAALLKDGVSLGQAQAEASVVATRLASLHPEDKEYTFELNALGHDIREYFGKTAEIAGIVTGLIFLLAVLNVNGILLMEHLRRSGERRLMTMLGATKWQMLRTFLVQSLALSFAGGILAAGVAALFLRTAYKFLPSQLPHAGEAVVDSRVLAAMVVLSAVAGVVSGMWAPLMEELRSITPGGTRRVSREPGARTTANSRRVLVIAQVGGAMALLSLTGMLLAHMRAVATADVGFHIDHLVNFAWSPAKFSWGDVELLRKNLEAIPGVESVAFTHNTPLAGMFEQKFLLSRDGSPDESAQYSAYFNSVSSSYFHVLGIPLREGRFFSEQEDHPKGYPAVVVNEAFVRRFSPTLPALGRRLCLMTSDGSPCEWRQIIGVGGDVRDSGIFDPPGPEFYLPWRQSTQLGGANVCVRTRIAPEAILGEVRKAVARTSPRDRASVIETVGNLARRQVSAGIVILYGAAIAAAVIVLLAAGGLYGTLFNIVRQSRREIGVRMAMGATPSATTWHFFRSAGKWVGLGLALGVLGAIGMNHSTQAAVYGLPSLKLSVLVAAGTLVIVVSFLAVLLPLREAARLNPAEVLRHE